jgi:hypothetical protein
MLLVFYHWRGSILDKPTMDAMPPGLGACRSESLMCVAAML